MTGSSRILVTGAGGFIGRTVTRRLLDAGHAVVGLDHRWLESRQQSALRLIDHNDQSFECVDLDMVAEPLLPLLRTVDSVIHLAGSPGVQGSWAEGFDHHVRNNVVSTQRLLEAALDAPVHRIVVASSSSVYGTIELGAANEAHPLRPLSPYGASKAAMEMLLGAYVERGLSVMPLRYFTVYGPHQRPDMAIHRMIEATRGGPEFLLRGAGDQRRSYTYVDDVARATIAALGVSSCEPTNVGCSITASVNEVISLVEEITGCPVRRQTVAPTPGDPQRTSADSGRAEAILGWRPDLALAEGLARQVEWQLALDAVRP